MIVPEPTDQFVGQSFTGLYFSINSSSLDVAAINSTTGRLSVMTSNRPQKRAFEHAQYARN